MNFRSNFSIHVQKFRLFYTWIAISWSFQAKELSLEILSLVEICLDERGSDAEWNYVVESLVQCLSQSHSQQFYSIGEFSFKVRIFTAVLSAHWRQFTDTLVISAIMVKLLKCLLKISEKKMIFKTKSLWKLLNAFHCKTPNSCMGLTITRLTVLCLCNILPLHPKVSAR